MKKSDQKSISRKFKKAFTIKGVDTKKYCGVIKLTKDALAIQKEIRDW